jgi:hypothetical protein
VWDLNGHTDPIMILIRRGGEKGHGRKQSIFRLVKRNDSFPPMVLLQSFYFSKLPLYMWVHVGFTLRPQRFNDDF